MINKQFNSSTRQELLIGLLLLLVLTVTRSGHFGSAIKLPDASWAMFWLAGALTINRGWPALFMLAAAIVDYFVIAGGVSRYCVTPAYPFLIPTYLVLWSAGRQTHEHLYADAHSMPGSMPHSMLVIALSVCWSVTVAFIISNASFYYFSAYFAALPVGSYVASVLRYWPYYLITTGIYVGCGLLVLSIFRGMRKLSEPRLHSNQATRTSREHHF